MKSRKAIYAALRSIEAQKEKPGAKEWLAIRTEAGQKLDPDTAEVICRYVQLVRGQKDQIVWASVEQRFDTEQ